MFVTNWISTTKIQKISEITNFFTLCEGGGAQRRRERASHDRTLPF